METRRFADAYDVNSGETYIYARRNGNDLEVISDTHTNAEESISCISQLLSVTPGELIIYLDSYDAPFAEIVRWVKENTRAYEDWSDGRMHRYRTRRR